LSVKTYSTAETGKMGEEAARLYLERSGYTILESNYRYKKLEADLIAMDGNRLVFVEVKTLSDEGFGMPEMKVNAKKQEFMMQLAAHYAEKIGHERNIRFDIISVFLNSYSKKIMHFKDAFYPMGGAV
jgi:putative endonuclease